MTHWRFCGSDPRVLGERRPGRRDRQDVPMYSKWVKIVAVVLLVILGLWILAIVPN